MLFQGVAFQVSKYRVFAKFLFLLPGLFAGGLGSLA